MLKYRMPDLSKLPDCCALSIMGKCNRLAVNNCEGEECRFKRTRKEDTDSLQYVYQRLSVLDIPMQVKIAKKYYGGSMPWKEVKSVKKIDSISV